MVHVQSPSVNVAVHKSRVKLYPDSKDYDKVYLSDQQEFELEFFNPLKETVKASITINGVPQPRALVLRPGERVWLERYMDTNHKFKFETYAVDGSPESKAATVNNGVVSVSFFKEAKPVYYPTWTSTSTSAYPFTVTGTSVYNTTGVLTSTSSTLLSANIDTKVSTNRDTRDVTGLVAKGESSNQTFQTANETFEHLPFCIVDFKIMPAEVFKEDIRQYCTNCATRIRKQTWKFCPCCGEKL